MSDSQMLARSMCFDATKPIGMDSACMIDPTAFVSLKSIEFCNKRSAGYDCKVSLTPMEKSKEAIHVFALRMSNLIYEYGWNAVQIQFDQGDLSTVSINSQNFATDAECTVTCIVQATHVDMYVESGPNPDPLPRLDNASKPLLQNEKGFVYHQRIDINADMPVPNVNLSIMSKNKIEIVSAPMNMRGYIHYVSVHGQKSGYVYA